MSYTPVDPLNRSFKTYSATVSGLVVATTPTDVFTISGSATNKVFITKIEIEGTRTAASTVSIDILKRSSVNIGGTSFAVTKVAHESLDPVSTVNVLSYIANPTTLGTLVGGIISKKLLMPAPGSSAIGDKLYFDWTTRASKPIASIGIAELYCVNLQGVSITGSSFTMSVEWIEVPN